MAGELEAVVHEMFAALDRNDADGVIRTGAKDMQGIDEILAALDARAGRGRQ